MIYGWGVIEYLFDERNIHLFQLNIDSGWVNNFVAMEVLLLLIKCVNVVIQADRVGE